MYQLQLYNSNSIISATLALQARKIIMNSYNNSQYAPQYM